MIVLLFIWLLAACSRLVEAGPLPLQFRSPFYPYFRNSTIPNSSPQTSSSPTSSQQTSIPSLGTSRSIDQLAEANTALVVEPAGRTIITRVQPAITFLDPKGRPLITQAEETILSTSFFSKPKPTPSQRVSPKPSTSALPSTPSSASGVQSITPSRSATLRPQSSSPLTTNGGAAITTSTGTERPQFTYSPKAKDGNSTATGSDIQSLNFTTTRTMLSTTTVRPTIPTIQRPGGGLSPSSSTPQNTTMNSNLLQSSQAPTSSVSIVLVTQTQYTTVAPPTISSVQVSPTNILSQTPTTPTSSQQPSVPSSSAGLPSTSLLIPPAVTITTNPASTSTPQTSAVPGTSAPPGISSAASSSGTTSRSSSADATPKPPGGFQYPTRSSAASLAPTLSSSPPGVIASTIVSSVTSLSASPSGSPSSSSKSDASLIVTPINPSQLFTVTVTATTTQKEISTVTATVKG